MKFSPEFIQRVSEANNIVDIISQYTQLKPAGGGLMGRCPFPDHPEKTPSFSVSESKQVYHCFGCHKKGNIFTFLQTYNGMSFRDCIEYLAGRANIAMPVMNPEEATKQDALNQKKKLLGRVNALAAQYFFENFQKLPASHPARMYAEKRKLDENIVQTFQIGYAGEEWDGLVKFLESKMVPLALAEEARLVKARTGGKSGYFDIFRDRLIFPIFSPMGQPIAFGGRIISQGEPKYLNSPETPVFHKGKVLYGLNETAKHIRSLDQAIVVEGYMDLISLYQTGITNVVATMGTALTSDHGRLLNRITKNVVTLFDGDSAGQEAAERSLPLLLASDVLPKGLTLPDDMDPDDFVKAKGSEALLTLIAQAPDLYSMILQQWMQGYRGDASEKVKLANRLTPIFNSIQDIRLKQLYFSETAAKLNVDEKWFRQALSPVGDASRNNASVTLQKPVQQVSRATSDNSEKSGLEFKPQLTETFVDQIQLKGASKAEVLLLGLALKNHANFDAFLESEGLEVIPHEGVKEVLKRAADVYRQAPEKFDKLTSLLASFVDHPEWLISNQSSSEAADEVKMLQDCLRKVKEQKIAARRKTLTQELSAQQGTMSIERQTEIMQALTDLKKEEIGLRSPARK